MQFTDIFLALRRFWLTVVLSILVAMGLGYMATTLMPKSYTSVSEHFVQTTGSGTIAELQQGEVFAKARAQSYAAVVNTPVVLQPVINELGLEMTAEELSELVTVSASPATVIISTGVKASTPEEAARRAAAIGAQLRQTVSELDGVSGQTTQAVNLVTLTEATYPRSPSSPILSVNLALSLVLGAAIGGALALLKQQRHAAKVKGRFKAGSTAATTRARS